MILLRAIGYFLLILAVMALGADLLVWIEGGPLRLRALGAFWHMLDRESLNLVQAGIQRYVWPPLWDPGMVTVLLWPAIAVFGVPGALLTLFARSRKDSWIFRSK